MISLCVCRSVSFCINVGFFFEDFSLTPFFQYHYFSFSGLFLFTFIFILLFLSFYLDAFLYPNDRGRKRSMELGRRGMGTTWEELKKGKS